MTPSIRVLSIMETALTALAAVSFCLALLVFALSQSAVHEIEALLIIVVAVIFTVARVVVGALKTPKP
jgi:hypothetical protein